MEVATIQYWTQWVHIEGHFIGYRSKFVNEVPTQPIDEKQLSCPKWLKCNKYDLPTMTTHPNSCSNNVA